MVPGLLRDTAFRRYWSASTISMFGDQISGIALPPALWAAALGGVAGAMLLLATPVPRFRMPTAG